MTNRNRNMPCWCGSGLKHKKCHDDVVKIQLAKTAYADKFDELIKEEQDKKKAANNEDEIDLELATKALKKGKFIGFENLTKELNKNKGD